MLGTMSFLKMNRGLHSSSVVLARTRFTKPKPPPPKRENVRLPTQRTHHSKHLRITPPIPPTINNIECSDTHPLWQFFSEKRFIRSVEDLDLTSRSWSIPELRRKSFEDLHSLWYTCLKERNILSREIHLIRGSLGTDVDTFDAISERIRETMWRIRHVLSERDLAFKKAKVDFESSKLEFIKEFEESFLNEESAIDDEEIWEQLKRFQLSIFGINEVIEENTVDRPFVDGLKVIANIKLKKFSQFDEEIKTYLENFTEISDAGEAFVLFTAENELDSMKEACKIVNELRENETKISRYDELETITDYVKQLGMVQNENEAAPDN